MREDGPKMFVPWEAVQSVCGELMHYPERYRVIEFPTDEHLQAMSTRAIELG
jgi:hypothetical protein